MQTPVARIHIEKYSRHNDDVLFETFAEKGHPIVQRFGQARQIRPNVERAARLRFDLDSHLSQAFENIGALAPEMLLNRERLGHGKLRIEQTRGDGLERMIGAAIEEGAGAG